MKKQAISLLAALAVSSLAHADIVGNWQFVSSNDPEDIQLFNGNFEFRADGTFTNTAARNTACSGASGVWSNDTGSSFKLQVTSLTCDGTTSPPDFPYVASVDYERNGNSLTVRGEGMQYLYQGLVAVGATKSDCLFNWAESHYPALFSSVGGRSQTAGEYYFRQYGHEVYLGISSRNNHVYYLSGGQLGDAGNATDWLALAGCQ